MRPIGRLIELVGQRWLRWRIGRARRRGGHDRALALLRDELYGDFTRPMALLYLEMAADLLALGRADEALAALRFADDAKLDSGLRRDKRLVAARALAEAGRVSEAEARLAEIDAGALDAAQRRRRDAASLEIAIARKDWAAVARDAGAGTECWRRLALGAEALRRGGIDTAREHLEAAARAAEGDPEAALARRQAEGLIERALKQKARS